jgi:hypothetical protein
VTAGNRAAARTVTGVVAGMVVITAAATVVGFWLSYSGLHDFAARAGLTGPEAWAWPASVDLFIAAGEAGVTISALRRERDWPAWAYLGLGFAMSVTGNVLHVHPGHLPWPPYAVAAVPPMAAMLALAALLRQAYKLAAMARPQPRPRRRPEPKPKTARPSAAGTEAAILAALASNPDATNDDLAAAAGVSARTARRYRPRLATPGNVPAA